MTKGKTAVKSGKKTDKPKQEKTLDAAIKDKLAERGVSKEWMKKYLIITKA